MDELPDYFGEPVAASYDDDTDVRFSDGHLALESGFLAELAGTGGRALELAIGTGRVALPLAARGVEVHGIDLSEAMVARLRAKPGGDAIPVEIGDFTTALAGVRARGRVRPRLPGLQHHRQRRQPGRARSRRSRTPRGTCGRGGCFVVETGVPGVLAAQHDHRYRVFNHTDEHHGIDEYDPVTQLMWSHHYSRAATTAPSAATRCRSATPGRPSST